MSATIYPGAVPSWAWQIGRSYLADLHDRWRHSQRARCRAWRLRQLFRPEDSTTLATAALLHDIGYSPDLQLTGFHAIDGAHFLRAEGVDEPIVSLVAYHSCAEIEADLRGLSEDLARFERHHDQQMVDALVWCDMTSSPAGEVVTVDWRLADIRDRYGPASIVGRFLQRAEPELRAAVHRIEKRHEPSLRLG